MRKVSISSVVFATALFATACGGTGTSYNPTDCTGDEDCPEGQVCDPVSGHCVDRCTDTSCPDGEHCNPDTGLCEPDSSGDCREDPSICGDGQVCDPDTGECVDDCREDPTVCEDGEVCDPDTGLCVDEDDCSVTGCDAGEVCDPATGECVTDCREDPTVCEDDEVCDTDTGLCRPFDCNVDGCPDGEVCDTDTGECRPFDCTVDGCETGEVCDPATGECVTDCRVDPTVCEDDEVCDTDTGLCRPYDCNIDGCPEGEVCETDTGDCRPFDCNIDGCPGLLTCNTTTGDCVDCTVCDSHETCLLDLETCTSLTCDTAIALSGLSETTPASVTGMHVAPDGGEDWYSFEIPTGRSCTVTIDATFIHADGNIDIELWNADCTTQLGLSASTDDDEHITMSLGPGTYKIYVYGLGGAANTYDLSVALSGCVTSDPPVVTITAPPDGYSTTERFLGDHGGTPADDFLTGTVVPASGTTMPATVDITVNGIVQTAAVVGGAFSATVVLRSGANTIIVSATNEGGTGTDTINVTSTVTASLMLVTLLWESTADLDLYITEPTSETAWYADQTTTEGGYLDIDNTTAYGPENFSFPTGTTPPTGVFEINAHYYDGTTAMDWTVIVVLNEGTTDETRQTFTGTLAASDWSVDSPANIRSTDAWANYDVTITTYPNPFDGSTAYGRPIVRIEHDPTASPPYFVIPTP